MAKIIEVLVYLIVIGICLIILGAVIAGVLTVWGWIF